VSFNFENLDEEIRKLMLEELELDLRNKSLYLSRRLNHLGQLEYPAILKTSLQNGNCETLSTALILENYWNEVEPRRTKKGMGTAKVPRNANQILAEGESIDFI